MNRYLLRIRPVFIFSKNRTQRDKQPFCNSTQGIDAFETGVAAMPEIIENMTYATQRPDAVKASVLEAIDYEYRSQRDIDITIEQPEYTSVCP